MVRMGKTMTTKRIASEPVLPLPVEKLSIQSTSIPISVTEPNSCILRATTIWGNEGDGDSVKDGKKRTAAAAARARAGVGVEVGGFEVHIFLHLAM